MTEPLAVAIVNPSTGWRAVDDVLDTLEDELVGSYKLAVRISHYAGHAETLARIAARHAPLVIAVGGDGTVGEVATGMVGTPAKLGIIPTGTTNVIARGLGIPLGVRRAARILGGPNRTRKLDVLASDRRIALHVVGCGFDALMVEAAPRALKRAAAWLAYVPAALRSVTVGPWDFDITVDDQQVSASAKMVLVANGNFVLQPRFELSTGIRWDDGQLDVLVFSPANLAAATALASRLAVGQLQGSPDFQHYRGSRVRITSQPPAPVEFDGDPAGTTPIELRILPQAISIVVPRERHVARERRIPFRQIVPFSRN